MNHRLIAIGDIHGCFDALKSLIEHKIGLTKNDRLVLLGDYIDRGKQSKEVVDFIIDLQQKGFDIVPLMGNHEAMLLVVLENENYLPLWIQNGGNETLLCFGLHSLKNLDPKYVAFFKGLRLFYSYHNLLFVHAGFNDACDNPFEDEYQMLWTRNEVYTHPLLKGKTIIHGHTPITIAQCQQLIALRKQIINIDTGCVYPYKGYGCLTALEPDSYTLFSV
ncbi:MAG TPA: metallophosphoesterase family protein [Bacteroidales bacterium]